MERRRRVALLAGLAAGLWLWFWAVPRPLVTVEPFDPVSEQETYRAAFGFPSDEDRRLAALSPEAFLEEVTRGRRVEVEGAAWDVFFSEMRGASTERSVPVRWASRVGPDDGWTTYGPRKIYRLPGEGPLPEVAASLEDHKELFLSMKDESAGALLKLQWKNYSDDDFQLGSGFTAYPRPPRALLYPRRSWAWAAWLGGMALYLALPRRQTAPGELAYPRWRVMLSDFLGAMLFFLFFALPFLIVGGSVQVMTKGWMFPPVFWVLAAGGAWIMLWSARWAEWRVRVDPAGLHLPGPAGGGFYPFERMAFLQRVLLRPPKWLVLASWAAAASGRGAHQVGAIGRASILSGTGYQALGIGLKGGGAVYLWLTDQAGTPLVPGLDRVFEALETAGIPRKEEVLTLERLTLPPSSPPPVGGQEVG